jgi:hypothetical protein
MELLGSADNAEGEDEDESMSPAETLRYQDPLDGMKSALHVAIEKSQEEVVWLLLWLASKLDSSVFPRELVVAAQGMGAGRELATAGSDIRELQDGQGLNAEQFAMRIGGSWNSLLESGVLSI